MVIRPADVWNDPPHFLNRTVAVAFTDQNVGGALIALLNAIGPGEFRNERARTFTTVESNLVFSVSLHGWSALAALNTVVRTHGRLKWRVGYCQPQRRVEFARIFLHTFDDAGTAGQPSEGPAETQMMPVRIPASSER